MRKLRRSVTGLVVPCILALTASAAAGCGGPGYTYAADKHDGAFFKVPTSWHEVSPSFVAEVQTILFARSAAGPAGGRLAWSRAYTPALNPTGLSLLTASAQPMVYATVQDLRVSLRSQLSFELMRNLLFPVTPTARQEATAAGAKLKGFVLIFNATITTKAGMRGINELFLYTIGGQPHAFDQTVLTNSATSKLYLLLVQCSEKCFLAHRQDITTVVKSFTVDGS